MNDDRKRNGSSESSTADINHLQNGAFTVDANGNAPPFNGDTIVFDPGPFSVPLGTLADDNQFGNGFRGPLSDSITSVTLPPQGYDRSEGYDAAWTPMTWNDYTDVSGTALVGGDGDGSNVRLEVTDAVPNGQYTVWAVKFASLRDPAQYDAFTTPDGNGLVGFQPLGSFGPDRTDTNNQFVADGDGRARLKRRHEGGPLTGVPGFRSASNAPFVGRAADYEQSASRLTRISGDLTDEAEVHLVGAYHYDDQTWGIYPGPFHLNHFVARF